MSKYGNKKVTVNGIKFDSKKEADRYKALRMMEIYGKITDLELQKRFEIIPAQYETVETGEFYKVGSKKGQPKTKKKCVERSVVYVADFAYKKDGELVVEDTKGMLTPDYILKRKMMLYLLGIKISEIKG